MLIHDSEKVKAEVFYPDTVEGIFYKRRNRFSAEVLIDGHVEPVHVKNTGRLGELLLPEARVTLQKASSPSRKTAYDLISVFHPERKWINIDSQVPNKLIRQYLEQQEYDLVKPEFSFGDSRIDFYMEKDGTLFLTEVKGCTLASEQEEGTGLFPDAPTLRGVRHLKELTGAAEKGYQCSIDFVIQMNGIHRVLPNRKTQPAFAEALEIAAAAGVRIRHWSCRVDADRIALTAYRE